MNQLSTNADSSSRELLPIASSRRTWAVLLAQARRLRALTAVALTSTIFASIAGLVAPWVLGTLVDDIVAAHDVNVEILVTPVIIIGAAAVLGGILTAASTIYVARLGETILARLRETVVDKVLHLPSSRIERAGTGDVLSRVGDDVSVVADAITDTGPSVATASLTVGLTGVGLFALDWRLGIAGLIAIPMYWLALRWYLPRSGPYYAQQRVAMGERSHALIGAMRGRATVRAYQTEQHHLKQINNRSLSATELTISVYRLLTRLAGRNNRAEFVGLAAVLCIGFFLVRADATSVGAITAGALYFHRLFNPIGAIVMQFDEVQSAGASLARIVGVIELPQPERTSQTSPPAQARLDISSVGHRYDTQPVLNDVTLHINPGERIALVGASGAGKTTLAAIAAGTLSPTSGSVTLGGVPLESLDSHDYIGLITQEVHVFSGRLVDDVRMARAGATDDEVSQALATVEALPWVQALSDGLDTYVGEGGHILTAAQSQQLALARLVLADPQVAILDEATAEAGSAGARVLERAAWAATQGRTTLIVAHRLTQAARSDRIVVLEHGAVAESGSHDELIAANGHYAQLWSSWTSQLPVIATRHSPILRHKQRILTYRFIARPY